MDWRLWLYLIVLLAYIGYPLYLLMGPPHEGARRTLALQLLAYGVAGLFWPGGLPDYLLVLAGGSASGGLALMFRAPLARWPWLVVMAYSLSVLASHSVVNPVWTLLAGLIFVVCFERALLHHRGDIHHA
jgi:hypothetical protein